MTVETLAKCQGQNTQTKLMMTRTPIFSDQNHTSGLWVS